MSAQLVLDSETAEMLRQDCLRRLSLMIARVENSEVIAVCLVVATRTTTEWEHSAYPQGLVGQALVSSLEMCQQDLINNAAKLDRESASH